VGLSPLTMEIDPDVKHIVSIAHCDEIRRWARKALGFVRRGLCQGLVDGGLGTEAAACSTRKGGVA